MGGLLPKNGEISLVYMNWGRGCYAEEEVADREIDGETKHAAKALSKLFTISVIEGLFLPSNVTQSAAR